MALKSLPIPMTDNISLFPCKYFLAYLSVYMCLCYLFHLHLGGQGLCVLCSYKTLHHGVRRHCNRVHNQSAQSEAQLGSSSRTVTVAARAASWQLLVYTPNILKSATRASFSL